LSFVLIFIGGCCISSAKDQPSCLDAQHHKKEPSAEQYLHGQCSFLNSYSCCTEKTSYLIDAIHRSSDNNSEQLYSFNYNHCLPFNLSNSCMDYFKLAACNYECNPYFHHWITNDTTGRKFRKERYYKIPICLSSCQEWFYACKDDLTCASNWHRGFTWSKDSLTGKMSNKCINRCETFTTIFGNASNFCSQIWDEEYLPTSDSEKCFKLNYTADEYPSALKDVINFYYKNDVVKLTASLLSFIIAAIILRLI